MTEPAERPDQEAGPDYQSINNKKPDAQTSGFLLYIGNNSFTALK